MSGAKLPEGSFRRLELPGGGYLTRAHYEQIPFSPLSSCGPGLVETKPWPLGYTVRDEGDGRNIVVLFIDHRGDLARCEYDKVDGYAVDVTGFDDAPEEDAPEEEWAVFRKECEELLLDEMQDQIAASGQIFLD